MRRFVRPSLRVLMLAILVLGVVLGWFVRRANVQRDAVAAIKRAGGTVFYDSGWDARRPVPAPKADRWPRWLVKALGRDYFDDVSFVVLENRPADQVNGPLMEQVGRLGRLEFLDLSGCMGVDDAGLVHLRDLSHLKHLQIHQTSVTGDGFKHLAGLTGLKYVDLPNNRVRDADLASFAGLKDLEWFQVAGPAPELTDACLAHLEGLVNLKLLSFRTPGITSAGLTRLHAMKRLESLDLASCGVTDLAPISSMTSLTRLNLYGNPIDDAGLAGVSGLENLTQLYLHKSRITDAGLAHVVGLTRLRNLYLEDTAVSDLGLTHLTGLRALDMLFLSGTKVTDAGLARLADQNPCYVSADRTSASNEGIGKAQRIAARRKQLGPDPGLVVRTIRAIRREFRLDPPLQE